MQTACPLLKDDFRQGVCKMQNNSIFKNKQIFSLEVFPPKKDMPIDTIYKTLDELTEIKPAFISVTSGPAILEIVFVKRG